MPNARILLLQRGESRDTLVLAHGNEESAVIPRDYGILDKRGRLREKWRVHCCAHYFPIKIGRVSSVSSWSRPRYRPTRRVRNIFIARSDRLNVPRFEGNPLVGLRSKLNGFFEKNVNFIRKRTIFVRFFPNN